MRPPARILILNGVPVDEMDDHTTEESSVVALVSTSFSLKVLRIGKRKGVGAI
jgi:hypothetical protein